MESITEHVDENYEPVEPNYYGYHAINSLPFNIDNLLDVEQTYKVNICAYEVNNQHKYPFLKYLLYKNKTSDKCYFPPFFITGDKSKDIVLRATNLLKKMLNNIAQTADAVVFNGFKVLNNNNNIYIFLDCTPCIIKQSELLWNANNTWFAIIDEIVNTKSVCNILIDECVTQLFIQNTDLCYLQNRQNKNYILPIVAYVARDDPKLHFTFVFGVSKSLSASILGAYYYFTNYKNSFHPNSEMIVNHITETNTSNLSQTLFGRGIIRFALFVEKTKMIQNLPNDPINNSEIKNKRSQDNLLDINNEKLVSRISDHCGKWAADYDSAYIANILLDDCNYIKDTPITVIRDYDQQVPLSYHYITNVSPSAIRNEPVYDIM